MDKEKEDTTLDLKKIWRQYLSTKKLELRNQLIIAYLHIVRKISNRLFYMFPKHVSQEDLYAPGVLGLIKAVEKYDPSYNAKFETYATLIIKGRIIDELRSLDWIPRSIHKRAQEINKAEDTLANRLGRSATSEEVSKELNISPESLSRWREQVRPIKMISINQTMNTDNNDEILTIEKIPDVETKTSYEILEKRDFQKMIEQSIIQLPEQERMVLVLYYYEGMMLKEIGKIIKVSESRISQIHTKAIQRLRKRLHLFRKDLTSTRY